MIYFYIVQLACDLAVLGSSPARGEIFSTVQEGLKALNRSPE